MQQSADRVCTLCDWFCIACGNAPMLQRRLRMLVLVAMLGVLPSAATALPLTSFRYEKQAQDHCPGDTVVWLDFRKEAYYLKRQKRYGLGSTSSYVCLKEARGSRYRRSLLGGR
jgi:hypothetical protein